MSTRARLAAAAVVALVSAAGIVIVAAHWMAGGARAPAPLGLHESAAVAPFAGYREVGISRGGRCVRVVVADTAARRASGLRGADRLGPYAGMLFAQSSDSDVAFTMSGVTTPLDVGWYSAGGARLGAARMRPCPGTEARCPQYRSPTPYRVALETPAGSGTPGTLAPCG